MIGWLWRVLIGRFTSCRHEWETIREDVIKEAVPLRELGLLPKAAMEKFDGFRQICRFYDLRCKKCGDVQRRTFYR